MSYLSLIVALTDIAEGDGATCILPGAAPAYDCIYAHGSAHHNIHSYTLSKRAYDTYACDVRGMHS